MNMTMTFVAENTTVRVEDIQSLAEASDVVRWLGAFRSEDGPKTDGPKTANPPPAPAQPTTAAPTTAAPTTAAPTTAAPTTAAWPTSAWPPQRVREAVEKRLIAVVANGKRTAAQQLLADYGVRRLKEVTDEKLPAFAAALEAL
jgi:hypothetical protein